MEIKNKKLPKVTVAISAYNEESNIKNFLRSVLKQKEEGFVLDEILLYSDGATDKTVQYAREVKSKKVKIIGDSKRLGKSTRLNQLYAFLKNDYLIQSDADVIFSHQFVIRDMIKPFMEDKSVGMCGGNPKPVSGKTFTEKAVNCTFEAYAPLRSELRGGDNVFSVDGRILAYKKELVKKIVVPEDTIANDAYTFFRCLELGYKYKYVKRAIVNFRSPQSFTDQVRQNTRFIAAPMRMKRLFDEDTVLREYFVPKSLLRKYMIKQFVKHPVMCIYVYLVNTYCRYKAKKNEKNMNAKWAVAFSTKGAIR